MSNQPLKGIRVVDSTYIVALPYAAGVLADMGAEVIKVEGPGHIDGTRLGGFPGSHADTDLGEDPWNRTALYNAVNRGKKSLTLDLGTEDGRAALKDLIKVSDVFLENFTPRVLRQWGMNYSELRKIKPDLIMVSNTGYGHGDGPYANYPAQANSQEATHGLAHITGYIGDIPTKAGQTSHVDFLAFWSALLGIATALRYRNRTGIGQWLDIGMYQVGVYTMSEYLMDWVANNRFMGRIGNRHPWRAPQGCYPCAGQDQWCVISVGNDQEWTSLCYILGRPELAKSPRFSGNLNRMKNHDELDKIIGDWTKEVDKFYVMEHLQANRIPAGAVFDARDANLDKHYKERGFLEVVEYPEARVMGKRVLMGRPWHLSKTPITIKGPAPGFGDNNREILMSVLGYSREYYDKLEGNGITGDRPTTAIPRPSLTIDDYIHYGRLAYRDPDYKDKLGISGGSSSE